MTPAEFCRELLDDPSRYHVPPGDALWRKALKYFANRAVSAVEFERILGKRAARGVGADAAGALVARQLLERWRHAADWPAYHDRALEHLHQMLGPRAAFREGQWEAIRALVEDRSRVLVVQRTGWGKSIVYFIATRLLRDQGAGPTLLISPLLSLMRNQIAMAERIGIRALRIDSENAEAWEAVEQELQRDACDVLLVSPERLANERFLTNTLPLIPRGIGLFVVDEAHCISDWGHDFRPDYRRIVRIVRNLPRSVPVVATTATANQRVIEDAVAQLGPGLAVQRGSLARPTLRLQAIRLADQAERLAWLAEHLPGLPGTGIVYCLTVADCQRVSAWLARQGIDAPAYYAELKDQREGLEQRLLRNDVKALVATVALGMGFDKPDLGFVVHYQRPGSVISYYQQVGRAGRAVDEAYAILLNGREDDEIQDYFIRTAFPGVDEMRQVLQAIEESDGLTKSQLQSRVNISAQRIERCLKLLELEGVVARDRNRYSRTVNPWSPDQERSRRITELRRQEVERMAAFVEARSCLMEFVARELDDPEARPCGHCATCAGDIVPRSVNLELIQAARTFLRRDDRPIRPRSKWPPGAIPGRRGKIDECLRNAEGRMLCIYGDAGWGRAVADGKYRQGSFGDELVKAAAELIRARWRPSPAPTWVAAIPSLRRPTLMPDLAAGLARALGLPFKAAIKKVHETPEQKTMQNSVQQAANIAAAFQVAAEQVLPGPVLLVDDMVDSGWTLALCGALLREAGSGPVYPFALASSATASGDS